MFKWSKLQSHLWPLLVYFFGEEAAPLPDDDELMLLKKNNITYLLNAFDYATLNEAIAFVPFPRWTDQEYYHNWYNGILNKPFAPGYKTPKKIGEPSEDIRIRGRHFSYKMPSFGEDEWKKSHLWRVKYILSFGLNDICSWTYFAHISFDKWK